MFCVFVSIQNSIFRLVAVVNVFFSNIIRVLFEEEVFMIFGKS